MRYLNAVKLQLLVVAIVLLFQMLVYLQIIPNEEDLLGNLNKLLETKGVILLFIISFAENLVGFNVYFPGSIPLIYGMSKTAGEPEQAIKTFLSILFAVILSNFINLLIGHITTKGDKIESGFSYKTCILTLWHPYLSSLTSLRIGKTKYFIINYIKYFIPISITWYIIGGVIIYKFGFNISASFTFIKIIFYAYLIIWIIRDLIKEFKISKHINL